MTWPDSRIRIWLIGYLPNSVRTFVAVSMLGAGDRTFPVPWRVALPDVALTQAPTPGEEADDITRGEGLPVWSGSRPCNRLPKRSADRSVEILRHRSRHADSWSRKAGTYTRRARQLPCTSSIWHEPWHACHRGGRSKRYYNTVLVNGG